MAVPDYVIAPRWVLRLLSENERQLLVTDGLLCHPAPDAWLEADLAEAPSHRAACLAAAVPPRATVIGETAAWVWACAELRWPLRLGVPHGQRAPRLPGVHSGRCLPLPADERCVFGGLRVLDPVGAAAEVAREGERAQAEVIVRRLIAQHGVTPSDIVARIVRHPRRPGNRRALQLIARIEPDVGDEIRAAAPARASSIP